MSCGPHQQRAGRGIRSTERNYGI